MRVSYNTVIRERNGRMTLFASTFRIFIFHIACRGVHGLLSRPIYISNPLCNPILRSFLGVFRNNNGFYRDISRSVSTAQILHASTVSQNNTDLKGHYIEFSSNKISDLYKEAQLLFEANDIPEPEESARYLLCEVALIHCYKKSTFKQKLESTLNEDQIIRFKSHCTDRLKRMPIQYIVGNWDFYGQIFACEPPILIPRPETEELIEIILKNTVLISSKNLKILDIGCGTGVIGLTLLSQLPNAQCIALDINPKAVSLSQKNAQQLNIEKGRYEARFQSFNDFIASGDGINKFDLIVSNPPYISTAEMNELEPEVINYEDSRALHGGDDGMNLIRDIVNNSAGLFKQESSVRELWMEVGRQHPLDIKTWLKQRQEGEGGDEMFSVACFDDFTRNPRFVKLKAK